MDYTTLKELYTGSVREFAQRPCSSMYGGECLTYSEFAERADEVASIFYGAGLDKGDKVALLSNNMPNWAVCYFAAVTTGLIIVPILPDFSAEELGMIIAHSDARALCVSDKLFSKVPKNIVTNLRIVIRTMNLGIISGRDDVREPCGEVERGVTPDDTAAIIYTSGTTSTPKGVMLSHGNLASQILMETDLFPVYKEDVFLSILPLSHTYECSVGMLYPFSRGARVVYLDKLPTASTLMPALKQVRPTIMLSVPLIIEKIYKSQIAARFKKGSIRRYIYAKRWFQKPFHRLAGKKLKKIFGGRLRFFGIGGAKLDVPTETFLRDAGFPFAIGYGLTETAPLIAGAVPGNVKPRSTGPVLKGIEARLENINPATGEGEIVVLSPSTMQGYYKNPEATASVFTPDGWFRTKDLGSFDRDGHLYIKGRLDNMIVGAGGENIYPEEIESVINSHFLVTDSLVKEERGQLVALVHFDRNELEHRYHEFREGLSHKMADIKKEIINYVNSKVSKSARITDVEEQPAGFEIAPKQKRRRIKYPLSRRPKGAP
ncbi:MAG: AMP-binding protein [Rikenellaceae bacterium]|nr:AMP-binding protein [Rikenellaceae bacterium]